MGVDVASEGRVEVGEAVLEALRGGVDLVGVDDVFISLHFKIKKASSVGIEPTTPRFEV